MKTPRSGFTLVELMVTMSILGILALVTVPQITAYAPSFRVNGAAKGLASELLLARMKAASANRIVHVAVDTAAQTLTVQEEDPDGNLTDLKTVAVGTQYPGVRIDYNTVPNVEGTGDIADAADFGGTDEAVFLPNGLLRHAGVIYLIPMTDKGKPRNDRMRALRVSLAGQVAILRYKQALNPPWEEY